MELSLEDAKLIYNDSNDKVRNKLESIFGKDKFIPSIKDKLKSFEDACALNGKKPEDVLPFPNPQNDRQRLHNVNEKLYTIAEGLNQGFLADFKNPKQKKWYTWFVWDANKSAFVFSVTHFYYVLTSTNVGVRLYFENSETAEYFGKQFIDLHNEALTL